MEDIFNIEHKNYSGTITKGCLALEGGAFRGIYTSGVLDYFIEHNLNLRCLWGFGWCFECCKLYGRSFWKKWTSNLRTST